MKNVAYAPLDPIWPAWMRRRTSSQYLEEVHGIKCAAETLAKYAVLGIGPESEYRGRFPVHSPAQLDAWAAARSLGAVRSTSEAKRLRAQLQQPVAA
jgi:hypothetical protein